MEKAIFFQPVTFTNLVAAASSDQTFQVDASASFIITDLMYLADVAGAAQTDSSRVIPLVTVAITDGSSGRKWMPTPVPVSAMFGTGEDPYELSEPRELPAKSSLIIEATNISSATAYNLRLVFAGYKVYN